MKMEIVSEFPVPATDQAIVVKGKRTKRPRPSDDDSSPATSCASTEEDQDMANCLILLARGTTPSPPPPPQSKNTSRKFTEMAITTAAARVGIYVYECKTCNRTFPSFQALGGHRASHKRPKLDQDDKHLGNCKLNCTAVAPPPPPSPQNKIGDQNNKLPKIHECSICGSEFASGQALGGHMRRHRAPPPTKPRNVLALDLDLNLPAPPEVDDKYNQQPRIVFPAAALVDCHY